jgi:hypothetical protein
MKTLLIDGDFLLKRGDKGAKWVVFDQQKKVHYITLFSQLKD